MRRFFLSGAILVAIGVFPAWTHAASYYFSSDTSVLGVGDSVEVTVFLEQGGDILNAVSGTFIYDPKNWEVQDVLTGSSFVNFWADDPSLSVEGTGRIPFSGITPGGFGEVLGKQEGKVQGVVLFSVRMKAREAGTASFSIENPEVFQNDGKGTALQADQVPLSLEVGAIGTGREIHEEEDTIPPLDFSVLADQRQDFFDGKWFLVFSAKDKQSGIDHYEVSENGGSFVSAESPYVLLDQDGSVNVVVRAYDRAGNITESSLRLGSSTSSIWWGILFTFIGIFICAMWARKKFLRGRVGR